MAKKITPQTDAAKSEEIKSPAKPAAKNKKALPEDLTPEEQEEASKQISLAEADIFGMANALRDAIKKEGVADKAAFYRQTLESGGIISKLRVLRLNPGMSKTKLGKFDELIDEIKMLIDSKLDGYTPGASKPVVIPPVEKKPGAPATAANTQHTKSPITTQPLTVAKTDEERLKAFAQLIEKTLVGHIAALPMTKMECFNFIKKSGRQYLVTINPDTTDVELSVVTISIGTLSENLAPIKLH